MSGLFQDILVGHSLAPVPAVEHEYYLSTGGGVYAAVSGSIHSDVGDQGQQPAGGRGRDRFRERRSRGQPGPPGPPGAPSGRVYGDRVGRFPGDYKKCITGGGEVICVAFQTGRCKK